MFTLNHFSDVVAVAKTFGTAALDYAIKHGTISIGAAQTIRDCKRWADSKTIAIENVNDGNIEYSVDAHFTTEQVGIEFHTLLQDVTIVRTGFGAYSVTVREAMEKGYIDAAILGSIMNTIKERNEAAKWLHA